MSDSAFYLSELISEANSVYLTEQRRRSIHFYNIIPRQQFINADKRMLLWINRTILRIVTKRSPHGGTIGVTCSIEEGWIMIAFTDQGKEMTTGQTGSVYKGKHDAALEGCNSDCECHALNPWRFMIRQMGGKLWMESEAGYGATFYYALPLKDGGVAPAPEAPADDLNEVRENLVTVAYNLSRADITEATAYYGITELLDMIGEPAIRAYIDWAEEDGWQHQCVTAREIMNSHEQMTATEKPRFKRIGLSGRVTAIRYLRRKTK